MAIHEFSTAEIFPSYCLTKNAGTLAVQMIAKGVLPDDMQVLSFHPGAVYTAAVQRGGVPEEAFDWDNGTIKA